MGRKALSEEEIAERAVANGFAAGANREADAERDLGKHVSKTIKDQDRTLTRYVAFCLVLMKKAQAETPDQPRPTAAMARAQYLCRNAPLPDLATTKDFIRFLISISNAVIDDEHPTLDSMTTATEWFFAGFTRVTGTMTDAEDRSEVFSWLRKTMTTEGKVVRRHRPKHNLANVDTTRLINTLWTKNDLGYIHERYRIQFTFIFDTYCWTGARLGAFFNGSFCYRDVELVLLRDEEKGWKLAYKIDQRWVKNNRDPENIVFGAAAKEHGKLIYNGAGFFLSMAMADKAIWGYDSLQDLQQQKIPPGKNELKLRYRESSERRPILRKCTKAGGVTEEPMPQAAFTDIFNQTLQNAGYVGSTSIHAIRRQLGKKIDELYTPVQRSQHLTQADPRVFGQSYMANCSAVDGQAAFRGEQIDHSHIDYFQGYGQFREEGLPCKLPANIEEDIENHPIVQDLTDQVQAAATKDALAEAKRCLSNTRRKMKRDRLRQYQKEWMQERRDWQVTTRGEKAAVDPSKEDFFHDMCLWRPERGRLAERIASDRELTSDEIWLAIADLYSLCTQDHTVLYLPQVVPVNGRCPATSCEVHMEDIPKRQRHQHIFTCLQQDMATYSKHLLLDIHYCHHCFTWVIGDDWGPHCQSHLTDLISKRCGTVVYCHTLVRPAYCPFCLGNHQLASSERMQSWTRDHQLWEHVGRHIQHCQYPTPCPHPLCETLLPNSRSLEHHFIDDHSISRTRAKDFSKSQTVTKQDSFVVIDPAATLKRRSPDHSRSGKPSKRTRVTTATIPPLHTTSKAAEHPDPGHLKDKSAATEDFQPPDVFRDNYNDLFAEFIHTPTFSDSGDETAVSVEQDVFTKQCSLLQGKCRENSLQPAEPQEIRSTIRIRLRVQPPKPKVTLRLKNPKAKKGRKSRFKYR